MINFLSLQPNRDAHNHFLDSHGPNMVEYSRNSEFTRHMSSHRRRAGDSIGKEKRNSRLTRSPNPRESGRDSSLQPNIPPKRNSVSNEPDRHKASISRSEFESPRADGLQLISNSRGCQSQQGQGVFNPTVNAESVLREM